MTFAHPDKCNGSIAFIRVVAATARANGKEKRLLPLLMEKCFPPDNLPIQTNDNLPIQINNIWPSEAAAAAAFARANGRENNSSQGGLCPNCQRQFDA